MVFPRLRNELLDASIDLRLSDIAEDGDVLRVTARLGGARNLLAALFGVPCLYLAYSAWSMGTAGMWIAAVLGCPVLAALALLFAFAVAEKSFDRKRRTAAKSLRILGAGSDERLPLPAADTVVVACRVIGGGRNTPGGHRRYTVSLRSGGGFEFSAANSYATAIDFAGRLGRFLSYRVDDTVAAIYRQ